MDKEGVDEGKRGEMGMGMRDEVRGGKGDGDVGRTMSPWMGEKKGEKWDNGKRN